MNLIGKYFSHGRAFGVAKNCQEYTVSKEQHPEDQKFMLRVEVRLLTHRDAHIINQGQLSSLLLPDRYISEFFFLERHGRKYMISIVDPDRVKTNLRIRDIRLSPTKCLQIMLETILLIEDLHEVGIRVKEPLELYLQVSTSKGQNEQCLSMLRCTNRTQEPDFEQLFLKRQDKKSIYQLDSQERNCLLTFFRQLSVNLQQQGLGVPSQIGRLILFLKNEESSFFELVSILTEHVFRQKGFILVCSFDPTSIELTIYLKKLRQKIVKQIVKRGCICTEDSQIIKVQQFFNNLLAYSNQIKIESTKKMKFYSELTQKISEICLEQEELPTIGDNQEETIEEQVGPYQPSREPWRTDYPYNCILKVIVTLHKEGRKELKRRGVGFLITSEMVITAAHVLDRYIRRVQYQIKKIEIEYEDRTIQVINKKIPQQFGQLQSTRRKNDYALLQLKDKLTNCRLLGIAKSYRTNNKISLVKINDIKEGTVFDLKFTNQIQIKNSLTLLEHPFYTQGGDSGSPVIVRLSLKDQEESPFNEVIGSPKVIEQIEDYYVIAIHSIQVDGKRKSLRLTEEIVNNLCQFEKQMTEKPSLIKRYCVNYEDEVNRIKKIKEHLKQIEKQFEEWQKKKKQSDSVLLQLKSGQTIQRGALQKEYLDLLQKYLKFIVENIPLPLINFAESIQIITVMSNFLKKYDSLPPTEISIYEDNLNMFTSYLKKPGSIKGVGFSLVNLIFTRYKQLMAILKLRWEHIGIYLKYIEYKHLFPYLNNSFFQQFVDSVEIMPKIDFFLIALKSEVTFDLRNKLLMLAIKDKYYKNHEKIESAYHHHSFPAENQASPFMYFSFINQYSIDSNNLWNFEYAVKFGSREQLEDYVFQIIQFVSQHHPFVFPTIEENEKSSHLLNIKFFLNFEPGDLREYFARLRYQQLIQNFTFILKFVNDLHKRGILLCCPLEFCLMVDPTKKKKKLMFSYFGHPGALYQRIPLIKNLKEEEATILGEYYPMQQINNSKGDKEAFKSIDVWMVGMSLLRLLNLALIDKPRKQSLRRILSFALESRISMEVLAQLFSV